MESLEKFRRNFTPDLEAPPRDPVAATHLTSHTGAPFILVREAIGQDHVGRMLAWFLWREEGCVGYIGANISSRTDTPFTSNTPFVRESDFRFEHRVSVWRVRLTDGTGRGADADFARVPSRGQGFMTAALVQIIRDLSACSWVLAVNPKAMTPDAKKVWARVVETPNVVVVRKRQGREPRDCAFIAPI